MCVRECGCEDVWMWMSVIGRSEIQHSTPNSTTKQEHRSQTDLFPDVCEESAACRASKVGQCVVKLLRVRAI